MTKALPLLLASVLVLAAVYFLGLASPTSNATLSGYFITGSGTAVFLIVVVLLVVGAALWHKKFRI